MKSFEAGMTAVLGNESGMKEEECGKARDRKKEWECQERR